MPLIPEVAVLLREGRLPRDDALWIARLKPESQMGAAEKMMRPNFTLLADCVVRSTITHGTPKRLGAAG